MTKNAKSPNKAWSELLADNEEVYRRSRPKRAVFILNYLENCSPSISVESYHEQGAFSGKDIKYIKEVVGEGSYFASDLDPGVAKYLATQKLDALACDAFSLPFKNNAFDLTFHSGLIVCFDNDDALSIVREQLRTTKKIAFIFAHNELSWVDKLSSFFKRRIQRRDIFNYRRYSEDQLLDMAEKMGLQAELYYYDNALVNFLKRNMRPFKDSSFLLGLANRKALYNEIVMVVRK